MKILLFYLKLKVEENGQGQLANAPLTGRRAGREVRLAEKYIFCEMTYH